MLLKPNETTEREWSAMSATVSGYVTFSALSGVVIMATALYLMRPRRHGAPLNLRWVWLLHVGMGCWVLAAMFQWMLPTAGLIVAFMVVVGVARSSYLKRVLAEQIRSALEIEAESSTDDEERAKMLAMCQAIYALPTV